MDEPRDEQGRLVRTVTRKGRGVLIYRQWKTRPDGTRIYSDDWTRRISFQRRRHYFNLGPDRKKAEAYADQIDAFLKIPGHTMAMCIDRFAPEKRDRPEGTETTIGDVLDAFMAARAALDLKEKTAANYADRLLWVVRYVKALRAGHDVKRFSGVHDIDLESERAVPVAYLTRDVANEFKAAMVAEANGDPQAEMIKKRSANSTLRNAKAVFSDAAREHYAGLKLPDTIEGFIAVKPFRKVGKRYQLPAGAVVKAIFADMPTLKKEDANAYVALLLALFCGLRKGEIAAARRWWIMENAGARLKHRMIVQAENDFLPKGRETGYTEMTDWAMKEILACCRSITYLIEGDETERGSKVFRRLAEWLKKRGLNGGERRHPVHELRKLFGSWVASRFDLFTAKTWCRHASITTTESFYADLVVDGELLELWDPAGETKEVVAGGRSRRG